MISAFHVACVLWFFVLGTVVGSFLNVCIYRLPWQKSVVWPDSRCPKCLGRIAARDNIPVVSWLALRGECRHCHAPISPRYALIEAMVGLLFVAVYAADMAAGAWPLFAAEAFVQIGYHLALVALLVAATFIDVDYTIIPDEVTFTGMAIGLTLGAAFPDIRLVPANASNTWGAFVPGLVGAAVGGGVGWAFRSVGRFLRVEAARPAGDKDEERELPPYKEFGLPTLGAFVGWQFGVVPRASQWGGLVVGVEGLLIGGALVWVVRVFGLVLARLLGKDEAMGFGDLTLLAMIGSFLGWQAAVLTFFIAPFFGLVHAGSKIAVIVARKVRGIQSSAADHEMPFGPYLGMAALFLLLTWPRQWAGWAGRLFAALPEVLWFLVSFGTTAANVTGRR
jgi:leader peptidase (prepilin peptidase) / N-methyltransferase